MKYTLLQLTQEVLSSMDSDEVNSISDTSESLQVAHIVRQAYFDLIDDLDPPEHYTMCELDASTDPLKPVVMYVPDDISVIKTVRYDCHDVNNTDPKYDLITFLDKEQFVDRMSRLRVSDSTTTDTFTITTVDSSTIPVFYRKDMPPRYYTSWDDRTIIFDSFDSAVDDTLQKNKTMCYGKKIVEFLLQDSFYPDLDENSFARLLNEAKQLAFAELKQTTHLLADRNAKRSRGRSFVNKFRVKATSDFDQLPNYGRR